MWEDMKTRIEVGTRGGEWGLHLCASKHTIVFPAEF